MPFFDQHWRLRWLGSRLAGVAAVLLPVRYLQVAAVWDQLRGWDMQPDYLFAGCSAMALLVVAFLFARSARRARKRMKWRMEMIAGVHPTAHTWSPGTLSASNALERHSIVERISKADRIVGWMFLPMFILCAPVSIAVLAIVPEVLINPAAPVFHGDTVRAFGLLIAASAMPLSLWLFGTFASDAWAPSPRFEIDPFGITWMCPRGRSVTVRWQDARLLESATYYRPASHSIERQVRYLLYGNDTVIRIDRKLGKYREVRQLLELIKEHTSLVPCKLNQPSFRERIFGRFRLPYVEF